MSKDKGLLLEVDEYPHANGEHLADATRPGTFPVTVVFTTVANTLEALREAGRLAAQFGAPIRVLVPSVVPYPLDLNRPRVDPLFRLRHFRTVCDRHSLETVIDVRLCRDSRRCIRAALSPHSIVLIGARTSLWPLTFERLLGRELRNDGHQVILIEREKVSSTLTSRALRLIDRFAFGVKRDDLADIQALDSRLNLRAVSNKEH
jgi:hypothetical protein